MHRILFAASEAVPYCKSGGLADVIGALSKNLDAKKYNISVVIPMYKKVIDKYPKIKKINSFHVQSGTINKQADLYHQKLDKIDYYFIRQDDYFYREGLYGYYDDGERFAFFDKAVLEMLDVIDKKIDIIHEHDWHVGMIPLMAKKEYRDYRNNIKHVFTIHNLAMQGNFPKEMLSCFNNLNRYFNNGDIKLDGGISFMKAAIMYADKISTVSNSYANEILTSEYGERMDGILNARRNDLWGIVNGIDIDIWNPSTDELIDAKYDINTLEKKIENKRALQKQLGLRVSDDVLLVGLVSRLTWQKGVSIILEKLNNIMGQDIQFVILGTGDNYIESQFKRIEYDFPHRGVFYCGYDEALSHKVYAGCDLFLMPSLFEPCGISQLISMRYGTLPLVREIGGLKDTVEPYNEYQQTGTGFSFKNFSSSDLMMVLRYAVDVYYYHKDSWQTLMMNAMKKDVSWKHSVTLYDQLYESVLQ